jgi:secreted trypsin-like serine protease
MQRQTTLCGGKPSRSRFYSASSINVESIISIQTSGILKAISDVSKPEMITTQYPHAQELFGKNRLQDSLALILTNWTPEHIVSKWPEDSLEFVPQPVQFPLMFVFKGIF